MQLNVNLPWPMRPAAYENGFGMLYRVEDAQCVSNARPAAAIEGNRKHVQLR